MVKLTPRKQAARLEVLEEVVRLGGSATWSQLHNRGLHYMTVSAAVLRGDLCESTSYHYALTDAGRAALERSEAETVTKAMHADARHLLADKPKRFGGSE